MSQAGRTKTRSRKAASKVPATLFIGGALLFVGAILLGISGFHVYRAHRLAVEGRITMGTVTEKGTMRTTTNGNPNTSYIVSYAFTAADHRFESSSSIDADDWQKMKAGDAVQVEYVVSNPRISQLGTDNDASVSSYMALAGGVLGLLGTALAVNGMLRWIAAMSASKVAGR
jgi:hypothetical protein